MSLLEGHADVVMDGVGPDGDPVGRARSARKFNRAPRGRRRPRPAAAPAARPRRQDGAVPRRRRVRPRASSTRSAWTASTPSGSEPDNLPDQGRDRRPRRLGRRGSWLRPPAVRLRPRRRRGPARRTPRARPSRRAPARRRSLVACSGGADSLALLAATVFEAREPAWRVVGVTVDHGLQDGSAEHGRPTSSAQMAALGADETASARVEVEGGGPRPGGGGPRGAVRRPRGARRALRRRRGAARPHPRRPGRDRAARAGPRLAAAGRWPGCAARFDALPPAAARRDPRRHRDGLPGRGHRRAGTTRTTTTRAFTRVRVRRTGAAGARGRARPGRRRRPGPHRRPAAAPTCDAPRRARRRRRTTSCATPATASRSTALADLPPPSAAGCSGWPRCAAGAPAAELFHEHVLRPRRAAASRLARPGARSSCPAT